MPERRRSWWGWGWEGEGPDREARKGIAAVLAARFGRAELPLADPVPLEGLDLPGPVGLDPPPSLAGLLRTDPYSRAGHCMGKSYRDVVRGFRGELPRPPDAVAYPGDEEEVAALLDWASSRGIAVVPYGAGSSVVGGVECPGGDGRAVLTIDLSRLGAVLEIDRTSRAARIQAGVYGPALEDQLRPHGLTLRHFPQSFEFSTLGGWLATRSGGHYATVRTHIDDFVESMRVLTPAGPLESLRLPASGAGPSPDRLFLGSEGALGVITEAWMRLQDRPRWRASAGARFTDYGAAVEATRVLAQSGLEPSNCRLLDEEEAAGAAGAGGGTSLLIIGFESADHPVDAPMARAAELVADHGGFLPEGIRSGGPDSSPGRGAGAVEQWRNSFTRAPYTRDALVGMSVIVETFETACTWDRFGDLHNAVTGAVRAAAEAECGAGWVTCRFTHVYPDGPAPYFTVYAPGRPGREVEQWDVIKAAASDALAAHGGTITHHHAVGRYHRPWYERQRPELFGRALEAAKAALDPAGVMNPGVLVGPVDR